MKPTSVLSIISIIIVFSACNRSNDVNSVEYGNTIAYANMTEYYLWKDQMPSVNPHAFGSADELISALRNTEFDRWTDIYSSDYISNYYSGLEYNSHGILIDDQSTTIVVVYPDTLMHTDGIRRGWQINKVNGVVATSENVEELLDANPTNEIEFTDNNGHIVTMTYSKENYTRKSVIYYDTIDYSGQKIGYFVFDAFINSSNDELSALFSYFQTEEIDELIIDLRYNSGGWLNVAIHLASLITDQYGSSELLLQLIGNSRQGTRNYYFKESGPRLSLGRVFFITTPNTASASEVLINSLKPYIDVLSIGDTTYGKPVGGYTIPIIPMRLSLSVIVFYSVNSAGEGYYFNGLTADHHEDDDISRDFGDINESSLSAALYYIGNGSFPTSKYGSTPNPDLSKYQRLLGTVREFEQTPNSDQ